MNHYYQGEIVKVRATFVDENGNVGDPTTVAFEYAVAPISSPAAATVTLTYASADVPAPGIVARVSEGVYEAQVDSTSLPGYWTYQMVSTGAFKTLEPGGCVVDPAPL